MDGFYDFDYYDRTQREQKELKHEKELQNLNVIITKLKHKLKVREKKIEKQAFQIKKLEIQIKYMPGGDGYIEAKQNWDSNV